MLQKIEQSAAFWRENYCPPQPVFGLEIGKFKLSSVKNNKIHTQKICEGNKPFHRRKHIVPQLFYPPPLPKRVVPLKYDIHF